MKLTLKRRFFGEKYTIGTLYVDGVKFCDTLEDKNRDVNQNGKFDGNEKKVMHETAIPFGTYDVTIDVVSPKYSASKYQKQYGFCKGKLPRLLNVPNFDGILIHIGNKPEDSSGCILVGKNTIKGQVANSTATFTALYKKLQEAKEKITIEIV